MNTLEIEKLAKLLLENNSKQSIEKFIGDYINPRIVGKHSYEEIITIQNLLDDLSVVVPNITGSFNIISIDRKRYLVLLDLYENGNDDLELYEIELGD